MKKLSILLMSILMIVSGLMIQPTNADTGYSLQKNERLEKIFDLTPLTNLNLAMFQIAGNGGMEEAFCVEPNVATTNYSGYTMERNPQTFTEAKKVIYNWYLKHYRKLGDNTRGEYMAVQLAIWGKQKGYDPINLTVLKPLNGVADQIKGLASAIYNDSYEEPTTGTNLLMMDKDLNVHETRNFDFTNETKGYKFVNSNKTYFRTSLISVGTNQKNLIARLQYTVSLENAPEGVLVTDANGNIIQSKEFGYELPQGSAFYVYVPTDIANSGTMKVKLNGSLNRFDVVLWSSGNSQKMMSRWAYKETFNHEFSVTYSNRNMDTPAVLGELKFRKLGHQLKTITKTATGYNFSYDYLPLRGAEFEIKYKNDFTSYNGDQISANQKVVDNTLSDQDGFVTIKNIHLDRESSKTFVIVSEINAPKNFIKDENSKEFSEQVFVCTSLLVDKVAGCTNDKVGSVIQRLVGEDIINTQRTFYNEQLELNHTVRKVNENGQPMQGVRFEVKPLSKITAYDGTFIDAGEVIMQPESDEQGNLNFSSVLPYGYEYSVKEIRTLDGYELDKTEYILKIGEDNQYGLFKQGETAERVDTIVNYPVNRAKDITFSKVNIGGEEIAGATIKIKKGNDVVQEWTSEAGKSKTITIEPGTYTFHEEVAPDGYLAVTDFEFTVEEDGTVTLGTINTGDTVEYRDGKVIVTDKAKPKTSGRIVIQKEVEFNNANLFVYKAVTTGEGHEFEVYSDKELTNKVTTLKESDFHNGLYVSSVLDTGTYYVKETKALDTHQVNGEVFTLTVQENANAQLIVKNKLKEGKVKVLKLDASNNNAKLSNIAFNLYMNGKLITTKTTDVNGEVTFENLKYGQTYKIEENIPAGYIQSSVKGDMEFVMADKYKEHNITVYNKKTNVKFELEVVKKETGTEKLLEGAEFSLYRKSDVSLANPIATGRTDSTGKIKFSELTPDKYVLKETKAPEKYMIKTQLTDLDFVTVKDKEVKTVIIENDLYKGTVQLLKLDSKNPSKKVSGAVYSLYQDNGALIEDATTDSNGIINFKTKLEYGFKGYIVEKTAPFGYKLNSEKIAVNINSYSQTLYKYETKDIPITVILKIEKYDNTDKNKTLANAEFRLFRKDDTAFKSAIATVVTNDKGIGYIQDIPLGEYVLKETNAPAGYEVNKDTIALDFRNKREGEETIVKVYNVKKPNTPTPTPSTPTPTPNTPKPQPRVKTGVVGTSITTGTMLTIFGFVFLVYIKRQKRAK